MRYLYQETSEKEADEIRKALDSDAELNRRYLRLFEGKSEIDKARLEPSTKSMHAIMSFARNAIKQKH